MDPRHPRLFLTHAKILWTNATHIKISTHATHAKFFSPTPKFYGRTPPHYPWHLRYLADSINHNENEYENEK